MMVGMVTRWDNSRPADLEWRIEVLGWRYDKALPLFEDGEPDIGELLERKHRSHGMNQWGDTRRHLNH